MQRSKPSFFLIALTLSATLFASGCSRGHSWGSGGGGDHGFKDGVRYDYGIKHLTRDGRVVLVLASNGCSASGGGTKDHGYAGSMTTADGRRTDWSCTTQDGKNGVVLIAGQQFDLSQGAVFLVSAKQNPAKVEQLSADLSKLPDAGSKVLSATIRNVDPRLVEFLKEAQEGK